MNKKEWQADIEITEALVKTCLVEQFPELSPINTIQLIGEGWDNRVFLINDQMIFRFPRRKVAVELLEHENRVLNHFPLLTDISIPRPRYIGQPTADYPYPFQGYSIIPGTAAYRAQLTDAERKASLPTLAHFLKQLHRIDEKQARALGVGPQFFDHMLIDKTIETLRGRVEKIVTHKMNKREFEKEVAAIETIDLSAQDRCLIHGDLDCRHLIFHNQKLKGIIDWGDMGINNKAEDLSIIWVFYPVDYHANFFKIYGDVDESTWRYARFLALYSAFTLMLYAADIGDSLLLEENVRAVKKINSKLIGNI